MKCERTDCDADAIAGFGSGRYCSKTCSNARRHTDLTKQKISAGVRKTGAKRGALTNEQFLKWRLNLKASHTAKYNATAFEDLGPTGQRRRVIEEQNSACVICNNSHWNGMPLVLEIDHIDGMSENNSRSNLRAICPNCHSTTPTWRGRNKPLMNGVKKVDDATLLQSLRDSKSIREGLLKVGMAGKGGNYARAKRLLDSQQ